MIDFASTTLSIVKKSLHLYYEEKDMNYLLRHCINDDIPMIGIVKPSWTNKLSVYNEHYQFYRQSEKAFVVYGKLTIREVSNEENHNDFVRNITINCLLTDNDIMFSSIHCSGMNENNIISRDINQDEVKRFYRDVFERCYEVFVEYDNINNTFYYSSDAFNELFEVDTHFVNADQMFWYICTECIHPDDSEKMDVFRKIDIKKRIKNNDCTISFDIRIKNSVKKYKWVRITILLFANSFYRMNKIILMIKDIDKKKTAELENIVNSRIDSLTGVFNRKYVEALIGHGMQKNTGYSAMALIDIDDFKCVNDTFGHLSGDAVLKKMVEIINSQINNFDILGRFGGDEFILFIRNRESESEIIRTIENIHKNTNFQYEESGNIVDIHISMGVKIITGTNAEYRETFELCDEALYKVKNNNKNAYLICD